jgi:hypothetical protein
MRSRRRIHDLLRWVGRAYPGPGSGRDPVIPADNGSQRALAPIGRRSRTSDCSCARSPSSRDGRWIEVYSDAGVSGAKDRQQRPTTARTASGGCRAARAANYGATASRESGYRCITASPPPRPHSAIDPACAIGSMIASDADACRSRPVRCGLRRIGSDGRAQARHCWTRHGRIILRWGLDVCGEYSPTNQSSSSNALAASSGCQYPSPRQSLTRFATFVPSSSSRNRPVSVLCRRPIQQYVSWLLSPLNLTNNSLRRVIAGSPSTGSSSPRIPPQPSRWRRPRQGLLSCQAAPAWLPAYRWSRSSTGQLPEPRQAISPHHNRLAVDREALGLDTRRSDGNG